MSSTPYVSSFLSLFSIFFYLLINLSYFIHFFIFFSTEGGELGLDQYQMNDRLFLKNPVDHTAWQPHLFFLSQKSLRYIEPDPDIEDQATGYRQSNNVSGHNTISPVTFMIYAIEHS